MPENKVIYNIIDNGDYKSFEAKIDSALRGKIKNLLKKPKSGNLYLRNKMESLCEKHDKMEHKFEAKLSDLAKSLEQISSTTEEIRTEINKLKKQLN
jgi:hypothetical protein